MFFHELFGRLPPSAGRCFKRKFSNKISEDRVFHYCLNSLRQRDYENYLCTLLMPKQARSAAAAIRAFNVEIAQIQDSVSERHIGKMRIQFWKDTLNSIYLKDVPAHPVAAAISWAVQNHKLTKQWFIRLLDARDKRLDGQPFRTLQEVEEYGEKAVSSVIYLLLEVLGTRDVSADHAASHLGKAMGLATLIRAMPYDIQARKVYLPSNLLVEHGVSHEDVIRRGTSQPVCDLTFDVASLANSHLQTAKSLIQKVPKHASPALLPIVPLEDYLTRLQRCNFNAFDAGLQTRNWRLPWTLLYRSFTRTF